MWTVFQSDFWNFPLQQPSCLHHPPSDQEDHCSPSFWSQRSRSPLPVPTKLEQPSLWHIFSLRLWPMRHFHLSCFQV